MTTTKRDKPVNVHNDDEMRAAGFFRPYDAPKFDWSKTSKEKKALKKIKHSTLKDDGHFYDSPKAYSPIRAKVIVQLRKNKTFPNTTYSKICFQDKIRDYLGTFENPKTGKSLVSKYSFNGKWYSVQDVPYNAW